MGDSSKHNSVIQWVRRNKTGLAAILISLNLCGCSCLIALVGLGFYLDANPPFATPSQTPTRTQVIIVTRTGITPPPTLTALPTYTPTPSPTIPERLATISIDTDTPSPTPSTLIELIDFTGRIHRGDNARLIIKTLPGNSCSIVYKTPSGNTSKAQGLDPQIADSEGICAWEWVIGTNTHPGIGRVIIYVGEEQASFPITIEE